VGAQGRGDEDVTIFRGIAHPPCELGEDGGGEGREIWKRRKGRWERGNGTTRVYLYLG